MGAEGLLRKQGYSEVMGRAGRKHLSFVALVGGAEGCPEAVLGWAPSASLELAFMPYAEGLLVERKSETHFT